LVYVAALNVCVDFASLAGVVHETR